MAKPVVLPEWATDPTYTTSPSSGENGTPPFTTPAAGYKEQGFVPGLTFVSQYTNWFMYYVYKWCVYLDGLTSDAQFLATSWYWTGTHSVIPSSGTHVTALLATGIGNGTGLLGTGGTTGAGVTGIGGATDATYGLKGSSSAAHGHGVLGLGSGTGRGGYFTCASGATALYADVAADGIAIYGGSVSGFGVSAEATGAGTALKAQAGTTGRAIYATGGSTGGAGAEAGYFIAGGGNTDAVSCTATGSGNGLVGNATTGKGLKGIATTGVGVRGEATSGTAVEASATSGNGVGVSFTTGIGINIGTGSGSSQQMQFADSGYTASAGGAGQLYRRGNNLYWWNGSAEQQLN